MTNAEKLAKNTELLVEMFFAGIECDECPAREYCGRQESRNITCETAAKEWLEQEVNEDDKR